MRRRPRRQEASLRSRITPEVRGYPRRRMAKEKPAPPVEKEAAASAGKKQAKASAPPPPKAPTVVEHYLGDKFSERVKDAFTVVEPILVAMMIGFCLSLMYPCVSPSFAQHERELRTLEDVLKPHRRSVDCTRSGPIGWRTSRQRPGWMLRIFGSSRCRSIVLVLSRQRLRLIVRACTQGVYAPNDALLAAEHLFDGKVRRSEAPQWIPSLRALSVLLGRTATQMRGGDFEVPDQPRLPKHAS